MLPDGMELSGRLRYQALLEKAEEHRLRKRSADQPASQATTTWQVRDWLGKQLVEWGYKLQGHPIASLPQLSEREPRNA